MLPLQRASAAADRTARRNCLIVQTTSRYTTSRRSCRRCATERSWHDAATRCAKFLIGSEAWTAPVQQYSQQDTVASVVMGRCGTFTSWQAARPQSDYVIFSVWADAREFAELSAVQSAFHRKYTMLLWPPCSLLSYACSGPLLQLTHCAANQQAAAVHIDSAQSQKIRHAYAARCGHSRHDGPAR